MARTAFGPYPGLHRAWGATLRANAVLARRLHKGGPLRKRSVKPKWERDRIGRAGIGLAGPPETPWEGRRTG